MKRHLIYCHTDPRTGFVRYVGRSSSGMRRATSHWRDLEKREKNRSPHYCWLRSLRDSRVAPIIECLEEFDDDRQLNEAERFWISYFRFIGSPLLNVTDGGDDYPDTRGSKNWMFGRKNSWGNHTPEAIQKISDGLKGKKFSDEHRQKIRENRKNQIIKHSPETRAKMSEARKLYWKRKHEDSSF